MSRVKYGIAIYEFCGGKKTQIFSEQPENISEGLAKLTKKMGRDMDKLSKNFERGLKNKRYFIALLVFTLSYAAILRFIFMARYL
jgi:hypothetical protein